jgi:hypothetical protein
MQALGMHRTNNLDAKKETLDQPEEQWIRSVTDSRQINEIS